MSLYKVFSPLSHDGKPYKEGDMVEMTEEQAEDLIFLKVIAPLGKDIKSTSPAEDLMIVTQQVSEVNTAVDPTTPTHEAPEPDVAPPSSARRQQQKAPKE